MNFSRKLLLTPFIAVILLAAVGVIGIVGFSSYRNASQNICRLFHDISSTRDLLGQLRQVHGDIYRALAWSQLGYSQSRIDSLNGMQADKLNSTLGKVVDLRKKESSQSSIAMLDTLEAHIANYKKWIEQVIDLSEVDLTTASTALIPCEKELKFIQELLDRKVATGTNLSQSLEEKSSAQFIRNKYIIISMIVAAVILVLMVNRKISGNMIALMNRTTRAALQMADKDLTNKINTKETDELGQIANAVDKTTENLSGVVAEIQMSAKTLSSHSHSLNNAAIEMMASVNSMKEKTSIVTGITNRNSERVVAVSKSSGEVSVSVANVAAAIEEMNSSLNEVAQHCQKEYEIASRANVSTQSAREVMNKLTNTAKEIGKVVEVINDIADQTNLLALNATIEAASAGEAGRGFAVVANEVKELARQTAKATLEIENQIKSMRANTREAIKAMEDVGNNIEDVNRTSQSIVAAVEEQSATIKEVSGNISGASEAATAISDSLAETVNELQRASVHVIEVLKASEDAAQSVKIVEESVLELVSLSDGLDNMVGKFKI
jgi:methyl-accepting chemotaxis protein